MEVVQKQHLQDRDRILKLLDAEEKAKGAEQLSQELKRAKEELARTISENKLVVEHLQKELTKCFIVIQEQQTELDKLKRLSTTANQAFAAPPAKPQGGFFIVDDSSDFKRPSMPSS